jgi:hypothetical protein
MSSLLHSAHRRSRPFRRSIARVGALAVAATALTALTGVTTADAAKVVKAVSTTTNVGYGSSPGDGACLNGNPSPDVVNCNLYAAKEDVWLSGLPDSAALSDGTYFFAILVPGSQPDPNDGADGNLSDDFDTYTARSFTMSGGAITGTGGHVLNNNKIQAYNFSDTTNPGGVYILAVCKISDPNSYPASASDCKYDAFKVRESEPPTEPESSPLTVVKDADGSNDLTYTWGITKDVDKTFVESLNKTATFHYTVTVTPDAGTVSNVAVTGTITVFNPNLSDVTGVDVTDQLSDGTVCTVTGGTNATVSFGDNYFAYSCDLGDTIPDNPPPLDNTATATWPDQELDNGADMPADLADFTFDDIQFDATVIDGCVDVTDLFNSLDLGDAEALGTVCTDDAVKSFGYDRTVDVPDGCVKYDNTATFTTDDSGTQGSDSESVTVCGPALGGHTMGWWQNKNGQALITGGGSTAGVCNSGTYLRTFNPFKDLSATATCAQVATYVNNVIKAASAKGASMNAMLKGQMLSTALSVNLVTPALGGKKIDLTNVCSNPLACTSFINASGAFGGASSLTVTEILGYASGQSNSGGSVWYGQVKATQEKAKDVFDAINNQVAFTAP